jgi:hypothetical protein
MTAFQWFAILALVALYLYSKGKNWFSNLPNSLAHGFTDLLPKPGQGGSYDPSVPSTSGQSGDPSMMPPIDTSVMIPGTDPGYGPPTPFYAPTDAALITEGAEP